MTVDVRLLGPLEIVVHSGTDAQRAVPLGGARQRTLLGLLALRSPAVVCVSSLIDGIWRDEPPPTAVKTLHAHMAYVRRALGLAGLRELIVTRPPGYLLDSPMDTVDAHRFERLSRRGREALAAGGAEEAVHHLRAALDLWRGDVLADCPIGDWATGEATRLDEARRYTAEELYAAEIASGQHLRVVAELEAMVARYPLRERLWELLMTALYRSGRQGDALSAYQRARDVLVEELGVEPGGGLRRLETAILRGDDDLLGGTHSQVRASGPAPVPRPAEPAARTPAATVPVPITALIGRRQEIEEVRDLLAERRLVTLTGIGGCGKTRLAIAVAGEAAPAYGDGVRFVDLTATTDPASLASTVASALGAPHRPDLDPAGSLASHLRPRRTLLVLDNCEHLVDACGPLIESLLGSCPELQVLATSREALGVLGEVAWPVPPLAVPPLPATAAPPRGLAAVREYEAVRLFLDRAAVPAVRDLRDEDAAALASICAGLDGLPLAIELAAARTTVLTVAEIARRIHEPALLDGRQPGNRPHHRALRQTMAWSYGLLDPAMRSRFRRLAVFVGGFTIDAAEAVWPELAGHVVDTLSNLVTKSLVVVDRRPGGARYRLLETLRHYAAEELDRHPEESQEARGAHAAYYRTLAEEIDRNLGGPDLDAMLDRLAAEHDNLRTALAWSAGNEPGGATLRFAAALARYCHLRGRYDEGRRWLEDALSRPGDGPSTALARALTGAARLAFFQCDYPAAARHGERALTVNLELDDAAGAARSMSLLGSIARERGDYACSLDLYADAVAAYGRIGDETGLAGTLQMSGFTSWLTGDLERAEDLLEQSLRRYQRLRDPEGIASARLHLAAVAHYRGQPGRARWFAGDALARFGELGFDEGVAWAHNILGLIEHRDGVPERAIASLCQSLEIHCGVGDRWRAASVLEALAAVFVAGLGAVVAAGPGAVVAAGSGAVVAAGSGAVVAAEFVGAATAIRDAIGTPVPPQERPAWEATMAALHDALPDTQRYDAFARGEALRLDDLPARLTTVRTLRPVPVAA
ncbi:MAG TPA: BTAD domain-containing putative transcriptional regulator [Pilimelia sp.]|nr:BTAD domain-containing putative transcriptional regulator [Pilimelia sp.]